MQLSVVLDIARPAPVTGSLSISGTPITTGQESVAYTSWTATAGGGTPAYVYSSTGLPTGIVVNSSTGLVSGTPTTAGVYTGTISVTDSLGASGSLPFTITITSGLAGLPAEPTRGYLTAS